MQARTGPAAQDPATTATGAAQRRSSRRRPPTVHHSRGAQPPGAAAAATGAPRLGLRAGMAEAEVRTPLTALIAVDYQVFDKNIMRLVLLLRACAVSMYFGILSCA